MGTPQQLHAVSGSQPEASEAPISSPDLRRMLIGTRALARNTWAFFASDSDQGLLFHLCFFATSIGAQLPAENRARGTSVKRDLCRGGRTAIAAHEAKLEARRRSHAKGGGAELTSPGLSPGQSGRCPHLARHYIGQVTSLSLPDVVPNSAGRLLCSPNARASPPVLLQETKPWSVHFEAANKSSSRTFHLRAKYLSHLRFEPPFVAPNNASYCARRFLQWRSAFLPSYLAAVSAGALPEEPGHQCAAARLDPSTSGENALVRCLHSVLLLIQRARCPRTNPRSPAVSCRYYDDA